MTKQEDEIIKTLNVNLTKSFFIRKIEPITQLGTGELSGLIITMDDSVETQLRVHVCDNKLIIQLSQLEHEKIVRTQRKTYLNTGERSEP